MRWWWWWWYMNKISERRIDMQLLWPYVSIWQYVSFSIYMCFKQMLFKSSNEHKATAKEIRYIKLLLILIVWKVYYTKLNELNLYLWLAPTNIGYFRKIYTIYSNISNPIHRDSYESNVDSFCEHIYFTKRIASGAKYFKLKIKNRLLVDI